MARQYGGKGLKDLVDSAPIRSTNSVAAGFRSALANMEANKLAAAITEAQAAIPTNAQKYVTNSFETGEAPVIIQDSAMLQELERQRQEKLAYAAGVAPRVQRLEDIGSLDDAANYVGGVVGATPVTMAPVLGAAVAGRVGGKLLAPAAGRVSPALASALPSVGSGAAAYATSYDMLADENLNAQLNDPIAAAQPVADRRRNARLAAAGGAVLDAVLPVGLAGAARKLGMSGRNAAAGALAGAGVEGATEAAQLGLQNMQLRDLGGVTMQDSGLDYLNAGVAGAIGGGAMSGAAAGAGYVANKFAKPVAPPEQSLAGEIDAARQPVGDQAAAENLDPSTGVEAPRGAPAFSELGDDFLLPAREYQQATTLFAAPEADPGEAKLKAKTARKIIEAGIERGASFEAISDQLRGTFGDAALLSGGLTALANSIAAEYAKREAQPQNITPDADWETEGENAQPGYAGDQQATTPDTDWKAKWDAAQPGYADSQAQEIVPDASTDFDSRQRPQESQDDPVLRSLQEAITFADAEGRFDDVVDLQEDIDTHQARRASKGSGNFEQDWGDYYAEVRHNLGDELFIGGHHDRTTRADLPAELRSRSAHGMSKARAGAAKDLRTLLDEGVDPNRGGGRLYTAPFSGGKGSEAAASATGTASGSSYTDGPFTLIAREGVGDITDVDQIEGIAVNGAVPNSVVESLRTEYPHLKIGYSEQLGSLFAEDNKAPSAESQAESAVIEERSTIEEVNPTVVADEAAEVLQGQSRVDEDLLAADPIAYEAEAQGELRSAAGVMRDELISDKFQKGTSPAIRRRIKELNEKDLAAPEVQAELISLYNQVANPQKLSDAVDRLRSGGTIGGPDVVDTDTKNSFADAKLARNTAPLRREIEVELLSSGLATDSNQAREVAKNIMLLDTLSMQTDSEINAVQYAAMLEGRDILRRFDQTGAITATLEKARELERQRLAEGKEPHASSIVSATRDTASSVDPDLFNRYPALSDLDSSMENGRWEESVMLRIMPAEARSRVLGINDAAPDNVKRDGVARPIYHIATWIDTANDPAASELHREDARKRLLSFYKEKSRVDLVLKAYRDLRSAGTKIDPRQQDDARSILAEEMAGNENIAPLNNEDYKLAEEREIDGAWLDNGRLDAQKDLRPVEYAGSGKHAAPFSSKAAARETAEDREWVGLAEHLERNDPNVDHKTALRDAVRSVRSEATEVLGASVKDKWNTATVKQVRSELGLPTNAKHQDDDNLARVTEAMRVKYAAAREDLARIEAARAGVESVNADPEATESEKLIAQEEYQTLRREAVQTHGREFLVNAHQGRIAWGPGKYSDTLGPQIEEMSSYPSWVYRDEDMASLEEAPADMVRSALNELKVNVAKDEDGGINLSRQEVMKLAENKGNIRLEDVDAKRGHRMVSFKDERTGKEAVFDVRRLADLMLSKLSKNGALSPKQQSWSQHRAEALLQALGSLQMIPGFENIFKGKDGKQLHDRIAGLILSEMNPKYFPDAKNITVGSLVKTKGGNFQRQSESDIRADVHADIESGAIKDPLGLGHDILLEAEVQKRLGQQRLIARSHTEAQAWAQREVDDAVKKGKFKHLEGKEQEAAIKAEVDKLTKIFNQQSIEASRPTADEAEGAFTIYEDDRAAGPRPRNREEAKRAAEEENRLNAKNGYYNERQRIAPQDNIQEAKGEEELLRDELNKEKRDLMSGKVPNRDLAGAPITYTAAELPHHLVLADPTARFEYVPPIEEAIAKVVEEGETPPVRGRATLAKGRDVKAEILEGGITEMGVLTNHSGGAKGGDTAWDTIGREFGVVNHNHYREPASARQKGSQPGQVDSKELTDAGVSSVDIHPALYDEGVGKATIASRQLGRIASGHTARSPYTIRNWAQVKNADAIFAVGQIIQPGAEMRHGKKALKEQVSGGTGVAVQMAINAQKIVYVFDQVQGGWFTWDGKTFVPTKTPVLTKNFAGIGTRELTPAGRKGIRDVYALTQRAIAKAHAEPEVTPGAKPNGEAAVSAPKRQAINKRVKTFIDQTNEGVLTSGESLYSPLELVRNLVEAFTLLATTGHLDGVEDSAAKKAARVWLELLDPKSALHIGRRALAAGLIDTAGYETILEMTGHAGGKKESHTFVGRSTPGFADDFRKAMKIYKQDKTMSEQELFEQTGWLRDARGEWRKDVNTVGEYTALGANLMQMEMNGETTRNLGKMLNGQGAGRALRTHMDKVTVSMPSTWSLETPNMFDEANGVIHVNPVRQILHAARRDQMFKLGDKVISYRELKLLFGKENAKGELVLASKAEVAKRFAAKFPDTAGALETALNDAAAASALEGVQRIVHQLSYAEGQVNNWTGAVIDYLDGDKEAKKLAATIADPNASLEERGAARLALLEQVAQTVGATIYNEDGSVNTEKRDFVSDIIAQQMAKDPREREIRNMLDSRFGTTYPKGSKLAEMEAVLTDEQRAVRDQMVGEVSRMIGTQISQQFDILDDDSEHGRGAFVEYRALDGSSVLNVLRFAAATQSRDIHVARHESVHAFFSMLKGRAKQQVWRDLRRAIVESSRVRSEIVNQYKDQKAVLDQLDPRKNPDYEEELMAYAFQLYVDGKLNLNPKSRNFFNKVIAFVSNILGLATQEQRAAALFDALFAGELNPADPEKGGYGGRNIANKMRDLNKRGKPTETFRNKLERNAPGVVRMADTLFATPTEVLRNSGSKALTELAEMFAPHMASARNGGLIANRGQRAAQFHNRWSRLVDRFEKAELSKALADAQAMRKPTTAAGREVRKFLADMYQYSNEAGVKRWDPELRQYKDIAEMQNYFPRTWEYAYISKHEDEFKALIKKHSKMSDEDIDTLLREIAENDGRIEILAEKAGLDAGFTPFQSSISQRGFTFIEEANAHEFAKFQSQDMNDIMAGYIEQAVHRAEYTRLFGNRGEVIDKFIQRAAVEDGISPEEIIQTYRYHIDALSGTLGSHSMGRGLRLAQATAITAQNLILLPFAIFSQAIDGLGSSVRSGNIRDAKNAYGQVLKDMTRFALRDKSYDYAQDVAEMLGVVSQEAAVHAVNNAGMFMMNKGLRNVNRHFFRWNGMSGWNDSMRKAAMITGIQFLEQHTGLKGGKVDERRFEELGLTLEEAKDMVVRFREGEKRGVAPEFSTTQAQAMYRFVDQAVIRPNASMRASWLSDPRWMIFAHLKQFTYGMHKVTIARAMHEADNDQMASLAILAGYAPMALAADMTKWALLGMNVTENWDAWDYMRHAVARGGLLGLWEFGTNVAGDAGSGRIPGSSLVGPTVEHGMTIARSLNVGTDKPVDWDTIRGRSLPGYKYMSSD